MESECDWKEHGEREDFPREAVRATHDYESPEPTELAQIQ